MIVSVCVCAWVCNACVRESVSVFVIVSVCVLCRHMTDLVRMGINETDCIYSEPTAVVDEFVGVDQPKLRLDYILGNGAALTALAGIACTVDNNTLTAVLSDHFPVSCAWPVVQ